MRDRQPLPVDRVEALITSDWHTLRQAVNACRGQGDLSRLLDRAEENEIDEERGHRRLGARMTHGQARYRVSSGVAARAFVIRWVAAHLLEGCPVRDPLHWVNIRSAALYGAAIAQGLHQANPELAAKLAKALTSSAEVDYSIDIANG